MSREVGLRASLALVLLGVALVILGILVGCGPSLSAGAGYSNGTAPSPSPAPPPQSLPLPSSVQLPTFLLVVGNATGVPLLLTIDAVTSSPNLPPGSAVTTTHVAGPSSGQAILVGQNGQAEVDIGLPPTWVQSIVVSGQDATTGAATFGPIVLLNGVDYSTKLTAVGVVLR